MPGEPASTPAFAGDLETHLTVGETDDVGVDRLRRWADANGWKCVHILLDRGDTASQPMLTRRGRSTLAEALAEAADAAAALSAAAGLTVVRTKVEAAPQTPGVPADDHAAAEAPAVRHFEHHVKLLLPADHDAEALADLAADHDARVSRNAFKRRPEGWQERFVTQRAYRTGLDTALAHFAELRDALAAAGHEIVDVEEEYVVYDDRLTLDAGWMPPG